MHSRRVVISGTGAITPLGHGVAELYRNACAGASGIDYIRNFVARTFPTKFAAEVKNYDLGRYVDDPGRWSHCGANTRFALGAARQALEDAGLMPGAAIDRTRFGVYLGCGEGIHDFRSLVTAIAASYSPEKREIDTPQFCGHGLNSFDARAEAELELHTTPAHLAAVYHLDGPNFNCLTACAASSQAIGEAAELIRDGAADLMLAGGSHSMIHPLGVSGFNLLTALSTHNENPARASRPFDLTRDGFVLGEGAGMLVLEELEHARRRGAKIYAELVGYGTTGDAYRVTDSCEDGRGAIDCMTMALNDSGLSPDAIDYINAHGTSTQVNDRAETLAIKGVFGPRAYQIPVSSTKSMFGHLIAAAGAVELIICVETIRHGVIPPTMNYQTPDPECDLDYVPNACRRRAVRTALSNSFGFGGQNISLIVTRPGD